MNTPLPYRIKIGVTGHRNNLPDVNLLKEKIRQVIGYREWVSSKTIRSNSVFSLLDDKSVEHLRNDINTPVAFSILTALAEGSDRIAAEVVLEIKNSFIEVVLPLAEEDYLQDFETETSKNEFKKLLKTDPYPVRLRNLDLQDQNHGGEIQEKRNQCYFNAGKYIVDQCDVLIAVWNYKENKGGGGTYDVIEYAKERKKPVIIISSDDFLQVELIKQKGILFQEWKKLVLVNNHQVKNSFQAEQIKYLRQNYFKELPSFEQVQEDNRKQTFEKYFFPGFIKAESISQGFKNLYGFTGIASYLLSLVALLILLAAYIFNLNMLAAYIAEAILLLSILGMINYASRNRSHQNWLEARALSEKYRVAGYFLLTDVPVQPFLFPGNSTRISNKNWVSSMLEETLRKIPPLQLPPVITATDNGYSLKSIVSYVKTAWIEDQLNYHKKFCIKKRKWNVFFEKSGSNMFKLAILLALMHIVFLLFFHDIIPVPVEKIMLMLSLSLPVMAATMEGIRKHREYSRNIRRSEQMILALQGLIMEAENIKTKAEFNTFMMLTARIMTNENEDWFQWMQEAKLEYHA